MVVHALKAVKCPSVVEFEFDLTVTEISEKGLVAWKNDEGNDWSGIPVSSR